MVVCEARDVFRCSSVRLQPRRKVSQRSQLGVCYCLGLLRNRGKLVKWAAAAQRQWPKPNANCGELPNLAIKEKLRACEDQLLLCKMVRSYRYVDSKMTLCTVLILSQKVRARPNIWLGQHCNLEFRLDRRSIESKPKCWFRTGFCGRE